MKGTCALAVCGPVIVDRAEVDAWQEEIARTLARQVHLLAWHYHCSERDILSMARHKRERCVRLVEDELQGIADGWSAWR